MLYFDQLLLRIILIGLMSSLLLLCFLLLRRWCGPITRRVAWLGLLIGSLLVVPLPMTLHLPATWPDWLFNWRLPDPGQLVLSSETITRFFQHLVLSTVKETGEIGKYLLEQNALPDLTLGEWLIRLLPVLRIVYLAGLVLTIVILTWRLLRLRRSWLQRMAVSDPAFNKEAWQQELTCLRDATGNYRRADVLLAAEPIKRPAELFILRSRRIILVPFGDPQSMPANEREDWLRAQMASQRLPAILALAIGTVVRCLLWFSPVWIMGRRPLLADSLPAVSSRPKSRPVRLAGMVGAVLLICFLLVFLAWQLPENADRDIRQIQFAEQRLLTTITATTEEAVAGLDNDLVNFRTGNHSVMMYSRYMNELIWKVNLDQYLTINDRDQIDLVRKLMLADGSWSVVIELGEYPYETREIWRLLINDQGQVVDARCIDDEDNIIQISGFYEQSSLTQDGGFILVADNNRTSQLSKLVSRTEYNVDHISRFDAAGQLLWRLDQAAQTEQYSDVSIGMDNGINTTGQIAYGRSLAQTADAGQGTTALLSMTYQSVIDYYDEKIHGLSSTSHTSWHLELLDGSGRQLWIRNFDSHQEKLFIQQMICSDSIIYLQAYKTNTKNNKRETHLIAVALSGETLWDMTLNISESYYMWDSLIIDEGCLTAEIYRMIFDYEGDGNYQADDNMKPYLIMQMRPDGTPIGCLQQETPSEILAAEPGVIKVLR